MYHYSTTITVQRLGSTSGVEFHVPKLVRRVRRDISDYAQLGAHVSEDALVAYCQAAAELREEYQRRSRSVSASIRRRFQDSLQAAEDSLIRLRLAGGAVHTVFARTIEYLLRRHGRLATVQLHPLIASIHPDLCDDSIDRVIDGKRFGKKWKHAVRTAQQQLKKQGVIEFDGDMWRLK